MTDMHDQPLASSPPAAREPATVANRIGTDHQVPVPAASENAPAPTSLSLDPLADVLERIEQGVVLVRSDTYPAYSNSAAEKLLEADADRALLARELRTLSRAALDTTHAQAAETEVGTKGGFYKLRATLLKGRIKEIKNRTVLVTIDRAEATVPSREFVMRQFGMTSREADVALLLARGARNALIASELHISAHTARHHTERVLAKLNVHARAEVARAIMAEPSAGSERNT